MISTQSKKKGVVLVELIASITIMGIVSVTLLSIMFFVFRSYQLTSTVTAQNNVSMTIIKTLGNEISGWNATGVDSSSSSHNLILTRDVVYADNDQGISVKYKLTTPDKLYVTVLDTQEIQLKYVPGSSDLEGFTHPDPSTFTKTLNLDFYKIDLDKTEFSAEPYEKIVSGGTQKVTAYLLKFNIVTISPKIVEIPITFPIVTTAVDNV